MSANPYESPETPGQPVATTGRRGFRLVELLVAVGLIGLVVACLLPSVRSVREPGRRMSCSNRLHNIAIALHNYHDTFGSFPPAYTVDASGKPLHSWRTLILPFFEQKTLYDKIDLSKPWDDPANQAAYETELDSFQCPSGNLPKSHTIYLAVVVPGGCFQKTESRKLDEIADDTGRALMVIEVPVEHAVPWMSPRDASEELILAAFAAERPPHYSGLNVACVNGQVRFLSADLQPEILRALRSISGNDDAVAEAIN